MIMRINVKHAFVYRLRDVYEGEGLLGEVRESISEEVRAQMHRHMEHDVPRDRPSSHRRPVRL